MGLVHLFHDVRWDLLIFLQYLLTHGDIPNHLAPASPLSDHDTSCLQKASADAASLFARDALLDQISSAQSQAQLADPLEFGNWGVFWDKLHES